MSVNSSSAMLEIQQAQAALHMLSVLNIISLDLPQSEDVFDLAVYDYIIVGGGTSGCVVASRLAEDPNNKVLLIEAGDNPQLESSIPALLIYVKGLSTWNISTEDGNFPAHQRSASELSQGKCLGGTSAINYAIYEPGVYYDYNEWAKILGDDSWNYENVLPYLKKTQKLSDAKLQSLPDSDCFGEDGPIGLTVIRQKMEIDYVKGFEQMGNEIVPSLNGNVSLGYANAITNTYQNLRQSSIEYLSEDRRSPNLHVLKNTFVKRVIFDDCNIAVGVEAYTKDGRCIIIRTRKEVILSAGAFFSPKILMLSGIGPKKHLTSHKIKTISDLPVGTNLQDHLFVLALFNFTKAVTPYKPHNAFEYPASVTIGFSSSSKSDNHPDTQTLSYVNFPKDLMKFCIFTYDYKPEICDKLIATSTNTYMMFTTITKLKYKSRGKVLLKSNDCKENPLIYTNFYSNKDDLEDHARLVQDFVKIVDTDEFKKLGAELKDPEIKECVGLDKNSIEYWKCMVNSTSSSGHDYCCTCALGMVVDLKLRVKGVHGLRVADASVMIHPVTGGNMGATMMIGEKVSDMIKKEKYTKPCCTTSFDKNDHNDNCMS